MTWPAQMRSVSSSTVWFTAMLLASVPEKKQLWPVAAKIPAESSAYSNETPSAASITSRPACTVAVNWPP